MAAPVTQVNFTGNDSIRCHATFLATVQVVDSVSGDPVPLSDFDEISCIFRAEVGDTAHIFTAPYQTSNIFPQNGTWWVDKLTGTFEICLSSIVTGSVQVDDVNTTPSGVWDALAFTTATGPANSYQLTVAAGNFATVPAVTRIPNP